MKRMNLFQELKLKATAFLRRFFIKDENTIFYIGGSDILPPPLNAEEEADLMQRFHTDHEEVRKVLIERNLRLVVYIAKKFETSGINVEDLVSIGTIGLIKAINTFKPDKNIKLATYASRCIENEILMHLRKVSNIRTEVSIEEPLNTDWDGNELLLCDILGTDNDIISRNIEEETDKQLLYGAIQKLSRREQTIMKLRFGLTKYGEKTQKEVADMLGISQSYISRLEKKILSRLKREISKLL